MDIHIYHHDFRSKEIEKLLLTLIDNSNHQLKLLKQMAQGLQELQDAVAANDTVIDSAIILLKGLADAVAALKPNQAAIDALAADIRSKTASLSQAVIDNTPAAEPPAEPTV